MQSGSLVSIPNFPKLPLAIPASNTAARSPKLASLFSPFRVRQSLRVARLAAVSTTSERHSLEGCFWCQSEMRTPAHSCARLATDVTTMNPYDKLDHAERAWAMAETAAFLG